MARFLFVSYAAAGHLTPMLAVASAMRRRGHWVKVLTAPRAKATLAANGLALAPPRHWRATLDAIAPYSKPPTIIQGFSRIRAVMREVLFADAPPCARDVTETLRDWPADVVVASDMTPGVSLALGNSDQPWATLAALITCPLPSRDLPPWGLAIPMPDSRLARCRVSMIKVGLRILLGPLQSEWSRIRRSHGLRPAQGDLADTFSSPYLYLVPSSLDFDRARSDLPERVHYVGPCMPPSAPVEAWQSPFSGSRPLVYATAGTVHNAPIFLRELIEASRGEEHDVFITVGTNNDCQEFCELPANVQVAGFVPQDLVLSKAAAVLCNGGSGAVMGALVRGRPLVLTPLAADQPENALRCAERGVGISLGRKPLSASAIRDAVRRILNETSFRVRAEELGGKLAALNGPDRAAELLEQLSRTKGPLRRSSSALRGAA
jgi:MGT family glycosyltransferase